MSARVSPSGVIASVSLVAAIAALMLDAPEVRADIYQYVDGEGVVHFTNQAPAKNENEPWKLYAKSKDGP